MKRTLPIVTIVFLLTLLACGGGTSATPTGQGSTPAALPPTQRVVSPTVKAVTTPAQVTATPTRATTVAGGTTGPATTPGETSSAYPPVGASGTVTAATTPQNVTLMVTQTSSLGNFLVDQNGRTLYLFLNDTTSASTCNGSCAQAWPPLIVANQASAGPGVDQSLIGTTTRSDGSMQVTYNGHPLYYFNKDTKAGDTNGQGVNGFGNYWYVVSPAGNEITK